MGSRQLLVHFLADIPHVEDSAVLDVNLSKTPHNTRREHWIERRQARDICDARPAHEERDDDSAETGGANLRDACTNGGRDRVLIAHIELAQVRAVPDVESSLDR